LIVGGQSIGIKLNTNGVTVLTFEEFFDIDGNKVLKAKGGGEGNYKDPGFFIGHYDDNGNLLYIEATKDLAISGGLTLYIDNGTIDLPSLYDGIPIDGDTIYWGKNEEGKDVIKAKVSSNSSEGIDEEYLK
jgi:hypothetical protein